MKHVQALKSTSIAGRAPKVRLGPAGLHLFDRASGINILVDEVSIPPEMWAIGPRNVSIALTNTCDLDCPYCYAPKQPASLQRDRLLQWLTDLDANGTLGVGFGGGEPTQYPQFSDLCRRVSSCTSLAVTFTTHGHRIDDALADKLRGHVHFIRLSMDGVGRTYETLRRRSFKAFLNSIRRVRGISPFGINYVVNSMTLNDLDRAAALAADAGAAEFLLLPEQPARGRPGIDHSTHDLLSEWVISYQGCVPLRVSEAGAFGLRFCDPMPSESGLRAYAHIDAFGVLRNSSFDAGGIHIGCGRVLDAINALDSMNRSVR
ncbi:MAG: radical SAM protein [Pirellulaceae bacterium]|nr:radical SAM protein [Pirellulaceae bacterium]